MRWKIVGLFVVFVSSVTAQSKVEKKIDKLYQKGKNEKVVALAGETRESRLQFYAMASNYELYKSTRKDAYLTSALKSLEKARHSRSEDLEVKFEESVANVQNSIGKEIVYLSKKKRAKARKLCLKYIDVFEDTLSVYHSLFIIESKIKPQVIEEVAPTEHMVQLSGKRDSIINIGKSCVGIHYKWGGETREGFDCSGFVKYSYAQVGLKLPHSCQQISKLGKRVSLEDAQSGDVILFGRESGDGWRAGHSGIIYKEGSEIKVLHSISQGVSCSDDFESYWKERMLFVVNIIDEKK